MSIVNDILKTFLKIFNPTPKRRILKKKISRRLRRAAEKKKSSQERKKYTTKKNSREASRRLIRSKSQRKTPKKIRPSSGKRKKQSTAKTKLKKDQKAGRKESVGSYVGKVTHFFPKIQVIVLKMEKESITVGNKILIKGTAGHFEQTVQSLQIESVDVKVAKKGQLVGLKVNQPAREGDKVYKFK